MSHRKLDLAGAMGTKIRIYLDGPYAGDLVELWRALRDFTVGLEREIKPKLEALGMEKELVEQSGTGPAKVESEAS